MADENGFENPPETDFHGRKRELLRRGVEKGKLSWKEIEAELNQEYLGDTELEVFLFTCQQMGIKVTGLPGQES